MKKKKPIKLAPEVQEMYEDHLIADQVYTDIVKKIGLPEKDDVLFNIILGILRRETKNFIVFSVWQNLDSKQTKDLNDFLEYGMTYTDTISHEDLLMEFAMIYPDLREKIFSGLSQFFEEFVARFTKIFHPQEKQ